MMRIADIITAHIPKRLRGQLIIYAMMIVIPLVYSHITQEDFSGEYFKNFPDIKNVIYFLNADSENNAIVYPDSANKYGKKIRLNFLFSVQDFSESDSTLSCMDYMRALESEGYHLTATEYGSCQSFELENDRYTILIRELLSDSQALNDSNTAGLESGNLSVRKNIAFEITKK